MVNDGVDEHVEMQEIKVVIKLHAPVEMDLPTNKDSKLYWDREYTIKYFISHWLEEGFHLPYGMKYKGFELEFGETFVEEPE